MNRLILALFALLFLSAVPVMAAGLQDATATSEGLLDMVKNSASSWNNSLRALASEIFWTLATIQFVWVFGQLALRKADLGELIAELVRFVAVISFFAALLFYSVEWAQWIISLFRKAASDAAGMPAVLQPGDVFGLAIELGKTVSKVNTLNPVTAFIVGWSIVFVVASFSFIAILMFVTLIKSYFIINAGVLFMAFGGSQWTREYALTMARYSVAIGAQLFVQTLLIGMIMHLARQWQAAYTNDITSTLVLLGVSFMSAYAVKTLSDDVQALITGVSSGSGSQIGAMLASGVAGMAAGAAALSAYTANGGGMLGQAGKSVADLIKSSFTGSGGPGGTGGGSGGASYMNSMGGGGSGSGSGGGSTGPSPRTGGGGYSQAPGTPPSAASSRSSGSGGQAASSAGQSPSASGVSSAGSASSITEKLHSAAHDMTDAAVRTVGTLGSLTVPGMEGAAGTSIGPAPLPPEVPDLSSAAEETPGNIIRPDSPSTMMSGVAGNAPVAGKAPVNSPVDNAQVAESAPTPAVDTMTKLQQALNNQGKIT